LRNKEAAVSTLKTNLEKAANEKTVMSQNMSQLEKRVSELNAQKEIYTTVIESLTKKGEEVAADKDKAENPPTPPSAQPATAATPAGGQATALQAEADRKGQ
jgi:chromosome segregation ATPase